MAKKSTKKEEVAEETPVQEPEVEVFQVPAPAPDPEPEPVPEPDPEPDPEPEPVTLVIDGEEAERWITNAGSRKIKVFDEVLITGEGLENSRGRTGIPALVVNFAFRSLRDGGVLIVPENLKHYALRAGAEESKKVKTKSGFLAFK